MILHRLLALLLIGTGTLQAFEHRVLEDIEFAVVGDQALKLDLHLPEVRNAPLIVWVHGGAWRAGSKSDMPLSRLIKLGYAVASVDYRLSVVAPFPAQAHDIKAAIRFLRAKAGEYGYDAERVAIAGSSAGGHLAAIVGLTNGDKRLEGTMGNHLDQSSKVSAVVSLYGAADLMTILAQSKPQGLKVRVPALDLLLGGQPQDKPELAKLASPVHQIDAQDPPLLLIHGNADPQMPPEQSEALAAAYQKAGLKVQLEMLPGSKHGGAEFFDETRTALMKDFLDQSLR
jgi:acetyl esterase/lipase